MQLTPNNKLFVSTLSINGKNILSTFSIFEAHSKFANIDTTNRNKVSIDSNMYTKKSKSPLLLTPRSVGVYTQQFVHVLAIASCTTTYVHILIHTYSALVVCIT